MTTFKERLAFVQMELESALKRGNKSVTIDTRTAKILVDKIEKLETEKVEIIRERDRRLGISATKNRTRMNAAVNRVRAAEVKKEQMRVENNFLKEKIARLESMTKKDSGKDETNVECN